MRFYCRGLPSVCARHCGSIAVFCLGSRLLFAALRQTERLAVSCVPVPPGRDRHSCVLGVLFGYLPLWFHFGIVRFICGDLDGVAGNAGLRGLAARPMYAFTQALWPCYAFRGKYAGAKCGSRTAAAPDCAKESNVEAALRPLWTLFTLRRGYVGAYTRRPQAAKNRVDTRGAVWKPHCGWPGGSCCIAIISTRTIGDLPDSDLWSGRSCIIARQQVEAGTAGRVNTRGAEWPRALPAGFAIFYCFASCNLREIAV